MVLDSLPGGRASLALPRAILRVTKEKAGEADPKGLVSFLYRVS